MDISVAQCPAIRHGEVDLLPCRCASWDGHLAGWMATITQMESTGYDPPVNVYKLLLKMIIEIVDFSHGKWMTFHRYASLPEGTDLFQYCHWFCLEEETRSEISKVHWRDMCHSITDWILQPWLTGYYRLITCQCEWTKSSPRQFHLDHRRRLAHHFSLLWDLVGRSSTWAQLPIFRATVVPVDHNGISWIHMKSYGYTLTCANSHSIPNVLSCLKP